MQILKAHADQTVIRNDSRPLLIFSGAKIEAAVCGYDFGPMARRIWSRQGGSQSTCLVNKSTPIMKFSLLYILTVGLALLAGCSSTPSEVSSGEIHARTFNFVARKTQAPSYADNREAVHKMIQSAITQNLAARGVTRVATGGDVVVAYLVITGNNVSTSAISDYFGIARI